jgi:FixJ family two-component response regulator
MSVRAMKAGAVEFLTKPVRHQDLLDASSGRSIRTVSVARTRKLLQNCARASTR